jgi:hypothetical protein
VTQPVPPILASRLPKNEIRNLIAALTVTDYAPQGWPVVWTVDPIPILGLVNDTLGAYLELSINAYRSVGVDDYRQKFNTETNALDSVYYGLRLFTLSMDCRSFAPDIPAWDILESIRLRMNNPRSVTANQVFKATGLSWIRSHPMVALNTYDKETDTDNRMIWRAVLDVEFSWASRAQVTDDAGSWIQTVGDVPFDSPTGTSSIPGTLYNADGTPYPVEG